MFGRGTASHWSADVLSSGTGRERRGGGRFYSRETGISVPREIFWLNGPVKDGGGLYLYDCHNVIIANCIFIMNFAKWGGGVYLEKCSGVTLQDNLFIGNFALRDGGAVSISHSTDILLKRNACIFNLALRSFPSYDIHHSSARKA
jgi:parallel beta-helix repeat protein